MSDTSDDNGFALYEEIQQRTARESPEGANVGLSSNIATVTGPASRSRMLSSSADVIWVLLVGTRGSNIFEEASDNVL